MATSYYGFSALNPIPESKHSFIVLRLVDPVNEPKRVHEILEASATRGFKVVDGRLVLDEVPQAKLRFENNLRKAQSVEIAEGSERGPVPRAGVAGALTRLLGELRTDHALDPDERAHLAGCARKALTALQDAPYVIARDTENVKERGRLSQTDATSRAKSRREGPLDQDGSRRATHGAGPFFPIVDRQCFRLELEYGEECLVLLKVEHDGPCPLVIEQYALVDEKMKLVGGYNLILDLLT